MTMTEERTIAAVITETRWETSDGEPRTSRTAHYSATCSRIKRSEITAHDVDVASEAAGLPCDYCWPATPHEPVQPAERDAHPPSHTRGSSEPERPARPQPARRPPNARPNRYPGDCDRCGSLVAAGSGILVGGPGHWAARHLDGDCQPAAGTAAGRQRSRDAETAEQPVPKAPAGHYAVRTPAGLPHGLTFVRVDRPTEGRWAGRTFVKQIVGGHPAELIRGAAAIAILLLIEADVEAAAQLYGQEIGRCCVCNRTLTDPESRRLGIGPECRGKRARA